MKQVFPFVSVITENDIGPDGRNTFIVVGAKEKLDLHEVCKGYCKSEQIWYMNDSDIASLQEKTNRIVLTDNYAPVEQLMAPVVKADADAAAITRKQIKARELAKEAEDLAWAGNLRKTLAKLEQLVEADPSISVKAYQTMALIFADRGKTTEALEIYRRAISRYSGSQYEGELSELRHNFALFLNKLGMTDKALEQYRAASEGYRDIIAKNPKSVNSYVNLGHIAAENGDFAEAVKNFRQAVELEPNDLNNRFNLMAALKIQGQRDEAIEAAKDALEYMQKNNLAENAAKLQETLQSLEAEKNQDVNNIK